MAAASNVVFHTLFPLNTKIVAASDSGSISAGVKQKGLIRYLSPINRCITVKLLSRLRSNHTRLLLVVARFGMLIQTVFARADLKVADVCIHTAVPIVAPGSFGGSCAAARSVEMITDWLAVVPGALVLG